VFGSDIPTPVWFAVVAPLARSNRKVSQNYYLHNYQFIIILRINSEQVSSTYIYFVIYAICSLCRCRLGLQVSLGSSLRKCMDFYRKGWKLGVVVSFFVFGEPLLSPRLTQPFHHINRPSLALSVPIKNLTNKIKKSYKLYQLVLKRPRTYIIWYLCLVYLRIFSNTGGVRVAGIHVLFGVFLKFALCC